MALPKQIQKQIEDAEQLATELGLENSAPEEEGPTLVEPPVETVVVAGTAEVVDITPAPAEAPPAEAPPAEAPPAEAEDKYKARYDTLKGKYDTESATMREQIANLHGMIAALQNTPAPAPAADPEPAPAEQTVITATERNDYGDELLDVVGRQALLTLQPTLHSISERLNKLENGVDSVQRVSQKTETDKVYDALNKWGAEQSPTQNWREINTSNEFKAWLAEADPLAGNLRGALLRNAFEAKDPTRVVAFFAGYLKEQTVVTPAAHVPEVRTTPVDIAPAAQISLETLVVPGTGGESVPISAHGDSAGRSYSQAEISAFYSDVHKGKYKNMKAEKDAIEASIHNAVNMGRITG